MVAQHVQKKPTSTAPPYPDCVNAARNPAPAPGTGDSMKEEPPPVKLHPLEMLLPLEGVCSKKQEMGWGCVKKEARAVASRGSKVLGM